MSDVDTMVPMEKTVTIGKETLKVRPYSVKDVIYFTRELMDGLRNIKTKYPSMEFKNEDILQYFPLVIDESPRLIGLLARAIGKEGKWLEEQTDLVGVSKLFTLVSEINDFGTIISNFRDGWSNLKKQTIRTSAAQ